MIPANDRGLGLSPGPEPHPAPKPSPSLSLLLHPVRLGGDWGSLPAGPDSAWSWSSFPVGNCELPLAAVAGKGRLSHLLGDGGWGGCPQLCLLRPHPVPPSWPFLPTAAQLAQPGHGQGRKERRKEGLALTTPRARGWGDGWSAKWLRVGRGTGRGEARGPGPGLHAQPSGFRLMAPLGRLCHPAYRGAREAIPLARGMGRARRLPFPQPSLTLPDGLPQNKPARTGVPAQHPA